MAAPKSGKVRSNVSPNRRGFEYRKNFEGPPLPPPPPNKDMFKHRNKDGKVIRALAGASVPPASAGKKPPRKKL